MKKIFTAGVLYLMAKILMTYSSDTVSENDLKNFVTDYKEEIYNERIEGLRPKQSPQTPIAQYAAGHLFAATSLKCSSQLSN